jgi:hypothetical protein
MNPNTKSRKFSWWNPLMGLSLLALETLALLVGVPCFWLVYSGADPVGRLILGGSLIGGLLAIVLFLIGFAIYAYRLRSGLVARESEGE